MAPCWAVSLNSYPSATSAPTPGPEAQGGGSGVRILQGESGTMQLENQAGARLLGPIW